LKHLNERIINSKIDSDKFCVQSVTTKSIDQQNQLLETQKEKLREVEAFKDGANLVGS